MSTKGFGQLLILIGVLLGFILFSVSTWHGGENTGIAWNIRYAELYSFGCTDNSYGYVKKIDCEYIIRLGHGLSLSLFIIFLGIIITREIIPQLLIQKYLPFLTKNNNTQKDESS